MNIIDIIILGVLLAAMVIGFQRGLVRQVIRLTGFILSLLVAFWLYQPFAGWLATTFPLPISSGMGSGFQPLVQSLNIERLLYSAIAFGLIATATRLAVGFAGGFVDGLAHLPALSMVNRWLGVAVALLEAGLIIIIAVNILVLLPQPGLTALFRDSYAAQWILQQTPALTESLRGLWMKPDIPAIVPPGNGLET
jgi:uncharacterized membrane protein required for colicin V production